MRLWLGDLRNGVLPLHVAIELSTPGALAALWDQLLNTGGSAGLIDAVELLLLLRHHDQMTARLRRVPSLLSTVHGFIPPTTHHAPAWWGAEREYAAREVERWIIRLAEDADRMGDVYPRGRAIVILTKSLRPLGPPSLGEIVAVAERQSELRAAPP